MAETIKKLLYVEGRPFALGTARVRKSDNKTIYCWTCAAVESCRASVYTVIANDRHARVTAGGLPETIVHEHRRQPIPMDMFEIVSHPSGNVYLPPTLWK